MAGGTLTSPTITRRRFVARSAAALGTPFLAVACAEQTAVQGSGSAGWATGAELPAPRMGVAAPAVGGRIYVVGDTAGRREIDIYDPASNRWSSGAPLPRVLHHAAAGEWAGKLYVIGGYVDAYTPTAEVHEYDPVGDRWRRRAPMPTARGALGAARLGNRIHAAGGVGPQAAGGSRIYSAGAHETFDPVADRWTALAPLSTPRDYHAVAARGGQLHAIGGRQDGNLMRNLDTHEAYDPATDRWQTRAPLGAPRSGLAAAALDDRLFVIGGERSMPFWVFGNLEMFDPRADAWVTRRPLPTPRQGASAVALDGRLYVLAGGHTLSSPTAVNEIYTP